MRLRIQSLREKEKRWIQYCASFVKSEFQVPVWLRMNYCSRGRIGLFGLHAKFRTKFEHQQSASLRRLLVWKFCGDIVVPATFSKRRSECCFGCCCPCSSQAQRVRYVDVVVLVVLGKKIKKVLASAVGEIVVPFALKLSEYCKFSSVTRSRTGWVRWQVVVCCCIVVPVGFLV